VFEVGVGYAIHLRDAIHLSFPGYVLMLLIRGHPKFIVFLSKQKSSNEKSETG
jgi:hypothetical protein